MSLFKLYCQFNLKRVPVYKELNQINYIKSITPFYFGLNMDINSTSQTRYKRKVEKYFLKSKVEDFFVTDEKFEDIVSNASNFNMSLKNTKYTFSPDNYKDFENGLFRQNLSTLDIQEYLKEFEEQGAKLQSITLHLVDSKEVFSLYDDGCVYLSHDSLADNMSFKRFLEYVITGRIV